MIATDSLSLVFVACFLLGLVFFIATALLGNLGHGMGHHATAAHHVNLHIGHHAAGLHTGSTHAATHAPAHAANVHASDTQASGQPLLSYLNPTSIMLFLMGFGFFGYVFHNTIQLMAALTLTFATISGAILAGLVIIMLARLFGDSEGATVQDVSDRTGLLGKVSITVQENSLGEIIYVSPGGMRKSIPARSIDGHRIERDQEVVVVNYQHGIAEVDTWEHFVGQQETPAEAAMTDELAKLRTLLDESSKLDSQLVMRKDLQKE
jgi:hypothetical protein